MKTPRALLLYDENNDCEVLRAAMVEEGCEVEEASVEALACVSVATYCLVLFDVPRVTTGLLEVIRGWRDRVPETTLIVAGGRTTQANRIAVLETGVQAYLAKPVAVPELRARVRAALKRFRSRNARLRSFSIGSDTIDLEARMVRASSHDSRLTPTECKILEHLASRMNQTVPSAELVKILWGTDPQKGVHSLRLFIRRLRSKLEPNPAHPRYLVTEPSIGYRLQVPSEALNDSVNRSIRSDLI